MQIGEVQQPLSSLIRGDVLFGQSMREHTSWRIGGPADIMVLPACVDDIRTCVLFAREQGIPLTVMGNGSNMLVKDRGIRGIVLKISRGFNRIEIIGTTVSAEAGSLMPVVAVQAAEAGLSGLEFAAGIPASVGGAISMNAGAHGKSIGEVVRSAVILTQDGEIRSLDREEIGFAYRKSGIREKRVVVLNAVFALEPGNPAEIKMKNQTNLKKRRQSQPLEYPNAGSVFANPPGQWAGWLVDQVGAKGMRVGDALVSDKHANFIVNVGAASAADVLELVGQIRQMVFKKFNIELKLEIQVVGE
ncbi:MAG: UDP-N-acetylenolpyruvoylglucosamine reductase [Firmicutes bacterium HGW-Firmicutes-14]|nr:MAG: UDP-N-acetylenolpyruvoylglucosamine reductase [Firmicutes bacterium HGW-Firmicutes-14]